MKRILKVLFRILEGVLCLLLIALMGVFLWSKVYYYDFYKDSQRSIAIPGLSTGFIPQGFAYAQEESLFLISGYMKENSLPSRVYMVGEDGRQAVTELLNEDGTPYTGHCGGVAINGDFVYISGNKKLCVFSATEVLSGGQAKQLGSIDTGVRMSFCTFAGEYLLSGTYASGGSYETPEYYHLTTPAGDENTTLIWAYKANKDAVFGIEPVPAAAFSARDKVQGIEVTDDGKVVLSTSYGLESSCLWLYEIDNRVGTVTRNGRAVPVYYLDRASLVETIKAPPMAEELVFLDGRIYVLTESACRKYFFGNFIDGRNVFAYSF